ncbi:MAG: serine hydrolase domain-containing protein [Nitriliruptorales bacterium]|nr:serine hydrolase domain-containing protein [Nitriliruptorales bacterium]
MPRIDADAVAALIERGERAVEEEGLPAAALALLWRGEVVVARTFGAPDGAQFIAFSTTKAIVSGTILHLVSEGELSLEDRAATFVPEFDRDGFREVTVEHLLTHRAGFPNAPMQTLEAASRERRGARYREWRLDWPPGEGHQYHPTSAHWVLADIALAVTGTPIGALSRERVLAPLGIDDLALGVPIDEQDRLQPVTMIGVDTPSALAIGELFPEAAPEIIATYADPAVVAVGNPGGGAVASAEALARYMAAWLRPDDGPWSPDWIADATGNIRVTDLDATTRVPANRTLVFVVAGDDGNQALRELGSSVGPRTFGCSGLGGQTAWSDPDSGLSFCFLTSGINHDLVASWKRGYELNDLASQCVRD